VACAPLSASLPVHAPEAVQVAALLLAQVRVDALPAVTELGAALKEMTGAAEATVTVVAWLAVPSIPEQVSTNSVFDASAPMVKEPLVASTPPQPPDAVHVVASVEDHVRVVVLPAATVVGSAVKLTVGAGVATTTSADCDDEPADPVQVSW
jgi:hypothetical protein